MGAPGHVPRPADLAAALPDRPRFVDVRGMLLSGHAEVSGGSSVEAGFVVRVRYGALSAVGVVGRPPAEFIARAVEGVTEMTPVLAGLDNEEHVSRSLAAGRPHERWSGERAIVHVLDAPGRKLPSPSPPGVTFRLASLDDPLDHLPPGLCHEMTHARTLGPIAVAIVEGRPMSFCYPVWTTESFWDVSIDTHEPFQRRSLATGAVALMVEHMRGMAREPVWGALASNVASLRLAARLGFRPVEEFSVFSKGPWAHLTGGFEQSLFGDVAGRGPCGPPGLIAESAITED